MNKKMRELQAQIQEQEKAFQGYMAEGEGRDLEKAEEALAELDRLQKEYKLEERKFNMEKNKATEDDGVEGVAGDGTGTGKVDAVKAFADAARSRFKANSYSNEGSNADGGYTVPQDIQTKINEYKQERFSLADLIDHESVTTKSGRRTYKTRSQHTGFTQVGEAGKIGKTPAPKFKILDYDVKKYAGYLPVTNELLEDSDANITALLTSWLGEEEIATDNAQILALVKTKEATALSGIKDIKKAVNVTLAAFAGSVRIVTNSDGLQYLDTLEDKNGRPLLSPDPVKPMEASLCVGTRKIPVTVVPNEIMPSSETAMPFIIGDLKEYAKKFDRKQLTLKVSDDASVTDFNAFEQDMTLIRGIMRADYKVKDAEAIVYGEIAITA